MATAALGLLRTIVLIGAIAAAAPAAAQAVGSLDALRLDALRMQQEDAVRRLIDQQNQLMAAEAQARADRAAMELRLQRDLPVRIPEPASGSRLAPAAAAVFPSIPAKALTDSNRRIQAAVRDRH